MTKRPHILITNDDGIHAPGIWHLWNSLKEFATLTVVAPASEQSGVGLCITTRSPLHLSENARFANTAAWSVTGTPADCVKMGLTVILNQKPDLIVSGINRGSNAGRNVLYSGTVGGVIEGTLQGIPGVAFSCYDYHDPQYHLADAAIREIVQHVLEHPLPFGTLLNVNFPSQQAPAFKGMRMARQGREYWLESPEKRQHPVESHHYYWLGSKLANFEEEEESDISLLRKGFITAVPVHVGELTDHQQLQSRKKLFDRQF